MQSEKRRDPCESQTTEETTTSFLRSKGTADIYRYRDTDIKNILAQFIDIETGACLECGQVHGFTNIDEARKRRQNSNRSNNTLAKLFWETAL
jgi:hypothetical protein